MNLLRFFFAICQKVSIWVVLVWALIALNVPLTWAASPELSEGSTLFERHCAGCHPQGGNIVRRRKTLKLKSLERDGYDALETLSDLVAKGRKNMPGFEEKLNLTQIEALSQFVLKQAKNGWAKEVT